MAALLREQGRTAEADRAELEGIDLTKNPAERALMAERLADGPQAGGVTLPHPAPIGGPGA
jgi:predicted RNA polymerase sigma factor